MTPGVLVVGAGPAGLTLALQAHDHGARVRVVERRAEEFRPSRALIVHPRTLEMLRPLGVVDALLARADTEPAARLHLGSRVVTARLAGLALPDTHYPHLSLLRQADLESVLSTALADRGVPVRRGTELVGLGAPTGQGIPVTLRSATGIEQTTVGTVAACDGANSTVRGLARIGWRGGPYRQEIVLADVELDGDLEPGVAHVVAGRRGLLFVFAIGERATWRVLATRRSAGPPPPAGRPDPPVPAEELQGLLDEAGLDVRICALAWSSRVHVEHRIADHYRAGPLFLVGDAAHTHSPAGGQGMNTGIQDAVNLGWKLALAASASCPRTLLDSYEAERRPVAQRVRALTDLVFWAEASTDPLASFVRGVLAPLGAPALPLVLGRRRLVAEGVRVLSGLHGGHRDSALSVEGSPVLPGSPRAGDRLPDATVTCDGRRVRLHELTARPGVHLLLHRDAHHPAPLPRSVHAHRLTDTPGTGIVAVRPDGYVGYRSAALDDAGLGGWLGLVGAL
jgi:2-polyprenyl-6-methoxyphenol hydroxylase-like FAD-dependent oxidoreductase